MVCKLDWQQKGLVAGLLMSVSWFATADEANYDLPTQMGQGGVGLIQTPTSRMAPEGGFALNYTDNNEYRFWSVSLQLFPWMEATARYTDVRTQLYSEVYSFSGDQTLKDKGLDVKFRLLKESFYLPQVSVGFRDFGGTGFFESEYVAASKAAGPFDFHLGVGWGYLGTSGSLTNPFCKLRDSFCTRPDGYSGEGGQIDYGHFFKGNAAIFGGVEYQTPWHPLKIKIEYEGNNYKYDRAGELEQDSRWNAAAIYQWRNMDFHLSYQRGNTVGFGFTYKFNLHTVSQIKIDKPPREIVNTKPPESIDKVFKGRLYRDLVDDAGFLLNDANIQDDKAVFYGNQLFYRDNEEAIERTGRIIASELPDSVKEYHLVENSGNHPMVDTVIDADEFKAQVRYQRLEPDLKQAYKRTEVSPEIFADFDPVRDMGGYYSVDTFWIQSFGNPEDFFLYQGGLSLNLGYNFSPNISVAGSIRGTVLENFDKFNFTVDNEETSLQRVRTYVREYVTRSRVVLDTAYGRWSDRVGSNLYAQVYGGYLETMFGGVGGELLYREVDSNLAYGIDVNYVQQRDYTNDFGFLDYKTLTGHASVYWRPEILKDTQIALSAGRFLAGDTGVNVDFAKRFDSGIVVGAYAAITNVSAEEYGEGSFTKGFYLSIPFDLFVLKPAKGQGKFPWIPIARDGGQMLSRPVKLIDTTEIRSPFDK
jgi:hypothetical protein